MRDTRVLASFRDPAGFLYRRNGVLLRQVNAVFAPQYDACVASGLYRALIDAAMLVAHEEWDDPGLSDTKHRVLRPEEIPYISYPYEWSFSQLKDAALLTLHVQRTALEHGFTLRDASAFNVQFHRGKPIFIDSLSFERYVDGKPWGAYRQFCQHFLAPLTLMAHRDLRLRQLSFRYVDGLPLDLVSLMLPRRSYFSFSTLAHIHLHASSQRRHQDDARAAKPVAVPHLPKSRLQALIASLVGAVENLTVKNVATEWGQYYQDTNYSDAAMRHKEELLASLVDSHLRSSDTVHDIGANTGHFSRIVAQRCRQVISHDVDEMAVENHYRRVKADKATNILPLIVDLANPTPPVGWDLTERSSFHDRVNGSSAIALALIHHLCIGNNVPLSRVADFFANTFRALVIEFVPKADSQVQRMLATRQDVFDEYDIDGFERAFTRHFEIKERQSVKESHRLMYAMTR